MGKTPAIMELIISLVVILVGGVDDHDDLCKTLPFLGILHISNNQVHTHL